MCFRRWIVLVQWIGDGLAGGEGLELFMSYGNGLGVWEVEEYR